MKNSSIIEDMEVIHKLLKDFGIKATKTFSKKFTDNIDNEAINTDKYNNEVTNE